MIKDPYIQENGTLKNRLGITDYNTLNSAEKDITFSKFLSINNFLPKITVTRAIIITINIDLLYE